MFLSVVRNTSKEASSAALRSSPLLRVSQPRSFVFLTVVHLRNVREELDAMVKKNERLGEACQQELELRAAKSGAAVTCLRFGQTTR